MKNIQRNIAPHARCDDKIESSFDAVKTSIHAPVQGATFNVPVPRDPEQLQSTHLHKMRQEFFLWFLEKSNFNPRTSCEVRPPQGHNDLQILYFNPRTSCEVRLLAAINADPKKTSIHAPHARCDLCCKEAKMTLSTSIHALHTKCDSYNAVRDKGSITSIHAPHARCDLMVVIFSVMLSLQSTHLMRGATFYYNQACLFAILQSTHLMRGATANKSRYLRHFHNQAPMRAALSIRKLTIKYPKPGAKPPVIFMYDTTSHRKYLSITQARTGSLPQFPHTLLSARDICGR